jgi:hypothetical protein
MRVRQLSSTGDMLFGNSLDNFLVDSVACVAQVVGTACKLWLGEWSFDTSQGLPYLEGILGKASQTTSDLTIQDYVLNIQGVVDITSFQSAQDRTGRTYVSQLSVGTQFSQTPVQVINQTEF